MHPLLPHLFAILLQFFLRQAHRNLCEKYPPTLPPLVPIIKTITVNTPVLRRTWEPANVDQCINVFDPTYILTNCFSPFKSETRGELIKGLSNNLFNKESKLSLLGLLLVYTLLLSLVTVGFYFHYEGEENNKYRSRTFNSSVAAVHYPAPETSFALSNQQNRSNDDAKETQSTARVDQASLDYSQRLFLMMNEIDDYKSQLHFREQIAEHENSALRPMRTELDATKLRYENQKTQHDKGQHKQQFYQSEIASEQQKSSHDIQKVLHMQKSIHDLLVDQSREARSNRDDVKAEYEKTLGELQKYHAAEKTALQSNVERLENQYQMMQSSIEVTTQSNNVMTQQLKRSDDDLNAMSQKLKASEARVVELVEANTNLEMEIATANTQIRTLNASTTKLEGDIKEMEETNDEVQKDLGEALAQQTFLHKQVATSTNTVSALEAELESVKKSGRQTEQSLREVIADAKAVENATATKQTLLEDKIRREVLVKAALQQKVDDYQLKNDHLLKQFTEFQSRIKSDAAGREQREQQLRARTESEKLSLLQEIDLLKAELSSLRSSQAENLPSKVGNKDNDTEHKQVVEPSSPPAISDSCDRPGISSEDIGHVKDESNCSIKPVAAPSDEQPESRSTQISQDTTDRRNGADIGSEVVNSPSPGLHDSHSIQDQADKGLESSRWADDGSTPAIRVSFPSSDTKEINNAETKASGNESMTRSESDSIAQSQIKPALPVTVPTGPRAHQNQSRTSAQPTQASARAAQVLASRWATAPPTANTTSTRSSGEYNPSGIPPTGPRSTRTRYQPPGERKVSNQPSSPGSKKAKGKTNDLGSSRWA